MCGNNKTVTTESNQAFSNYSFAETASCICPIQMIYQNQKYILIEKLRVGSEIRMAFIAPLSTDTFTYNSPDN